MYDAVMEFGFVFSGGTAIEQFDHAILAEEARWDGVFVWEAAYPVDGWTLWRPCRSGRSGFGRGRWSGRFAAARPVARSMESGRTRGSS